VNGISDDGHSTDACLYYTRAENYPNSLSQYVADHSDRVAALLAGLTIRDRVASSCCNHCSALIGQRTSTLSTIHEHEQWDGDTRLSSPATFHDQKIVDVGTAWSSLSDTLTASTMSQQSSFSDTSSRSEVTALSSLILGDPAFPKNVDPDRDMVVDESSTTMNSETDITLQGTVPIWNRNETETEIGPPFCQPLEPSSTARLPCDLIIVGGCNKSFDINEPNEWMDHLKSHLKGVLPHKTMCWFCDDFIFEVNIADPDRCGDDVLFSRLHHILDHIEADPGVLKTQRPDRYLLRHMFNNNLVEDKEILRFMMALKGDYFTPGKGKDWLLLKILSSTRNLFGQYAKHCADQFTDDTPGEGRSNQRPQRTPKSETHAGERLSKRLRSHSRGSDNSASEDRDRRPKKRGPEHPSVSYQVKRYACPYAKYDPVQYETCRELSYKDFGRVRYVIQWISMINWLQILSLTCI
jgi:hypothetical protein